MASYDVEKIVSVIRQLQEIGESRPQITKRLLDAGIDHSSIDDAFTRVEKAPPAPEPAPEPREESKLAALISKRPQEPALPTTPSGQESYLNEEVPTMQDFEDGLKESVTSRKPGQREAAGLEDVRAELADLKASSEVIEDLLKKVLESQKALLLELKKSA